MTIGLVALPKEDRREEITRMWKLGKIPLPGGWELIEKDEWYLSTGSSTEEKDVYVAQFWDPQARCDVLKFALALYNC